MAVTNDVLQSLLDDLRFGEAEAVATSDVERQRLLEARQAATERALTLQAEMVEAGREGDHRRVLDLANHPHTERLLPLLSPAARDRAELQLRLANRWVDERRATARRRLGEARRALDGLDFTLARGLLQKIDGDLLDDGGRAERDKMLLELSARSMEMEELASRASRIVAEARPPQPKRRWFRRR